MTRRERLENKLARRQEWAQKATFRSAAAFGSARRLASAIPFGQPILVGHHSERRARRDAERIHNGMSKGVELGKLAAHHNGAARGLAIQLKSSIFSDDANAVEALEQKAQKIEAEIAKMKAANAAIRKNAKIGEAVQVGALVALGFPESIARDLLKPDFAGRIGFPSYHLSNRGAEACRARKRIEEVKAQQARQAAAEAAPGGVLIEGGGEYVRVTFPEKPAREILDALRAAGFRWGQGSWTGRRDALPAEVKSL